MGRGQISIDLLFAVTLVMLTVVSLINLSAQEMEGARVIDRTAQLKVFAVELRDSVVKVYSSGGGFAVRKEVPLKLHPGENVRVTLDNSTNALVVTAWIGGKSYRVAQRLPVPLSKKTSVKLTATDPSLWIIASYNETTGMVDVEVSGNRP
ncbi:hypothetical protein [Thermococcus sp.]|uniref:hypothetical protein n=1 Tax=Thermococcus sp. TaxID=35749 RepID=UPI0026142CB5|nr:hypothetical protein [Thermococcus sp.]